MMSHVSSLLFAALAMFLAIAHTAQANESDGSECINVVATEPACDPEKYQWYLDDMVENPDGFSENDPNYIARLGDRGRFSMIVGDWAAGITDLDVVIASDPDNYYYYQWRGWAHLVLNNLQQAQADFSRVIRLHATNALGYLGRCRVKQAKKDWNMALVDCQQSLQIHNATAQAADSRLTMGQIFEAKGLPDLARHSYQGAIEEAPDHEAAQAALAALDAAADKSE